MSAVASTYQTGKTVHVHTKHYTYNEDGRMAPGVCGNGSVLLSHSGNVLTRIGIHTHTRDILHLYLDRAGKNIHHHSTNFHTVKCKYLIAFL